MCFDPCEYTHKVGHIILLSALTGFHLGFLSGGGGGGGGGANATFPELRGGGKDYSMFSICEE